MRKFWKIGLAALAVVVLAGGAVGFVAAQTGDEDRSASKHEDFNARLAENLGITQEELEAAIKQTKLDMVDEALAAGRIDEEQAAELRERIESGEKLRPGKHGRPHRAGGHIIEQVAELLGVTPEEIVEALKDGQSLAQIAEANGVSAEELTATLLAGIEERLAQAVEDGKIDQARADEILANAAERIEELINREGLPDRGHRRPFGGQGFEGGGPDEGGFVPPGVVPLF